MNRSALSISIAFLLAGLAGGLLLVADLWIKNAPSAAISEGGPSAPSQSPAAVSGGKPASPPAVDGVIAEGEYAQVLQDEETGISLYWSIAEDKIYIGLRSPGSGWLAVGFSPEGPMMKGADILIGYVKDGQAFARDHYADGQVAHRHDEELGGTDDIEKFAGSEDESGTTLELVRPLKTGDAYDKPIEPGEVKVLLAYSDSDDWTSYHKKRTVVTVDFFAGGTLAASAAATPTPAASSKPSSLPAIDGTIAEGEYANVFRDEGTGMELYWTVAGDSLYVGLRSPGHGWLAVGLEPDGPMMKGADILIGYVKDGEAAMQDSYADGQVTHKPDEELGGQNNIKEFAGSEDASGTTIEFVRALDTQDAYDKPIEPGEMTVMLAYAAEKDDWIKYHTGRSLIKIDFFAGGGQP